MAMTDQELHDQRDLIDDYGLVMEIMGDPDRKERMRCALLRLLRQAHPVDWAMGGKRRAQLQRAAEETVNDPVPTPELVELCKMMFPFRHATGDN